MVRLAITVHGIVQGVGFRPYIYGLACRLGLGGFVRNQSGTVLIEIEGAKEKVDQFLEQLRTGPAPPLAKIEAIQSRPVEVRHEARFEILQSQADATTDVLISPDIATCDDCVAELFDPKNRRYRYPFTNCTNCGPRLTIIRGAPYDRALTTMAAFEMCPACRAEYQNPLDRRFHAQPIACAQCGPALSLLNENGQPIGGDALQESIASIAMGKIVAIKGLGGYHLACDARNEEAVKQLRRRKALDEKPFALMVQNAQAARALCQVDDKEF